MARGKRTANTLPRLTVPHLKLVFGGTLGNPAAEIWACSLKLVWFPDGATGGTITSADNSFLEQGTAVSNAQGFTAGNPSSLVGAIDATFLPACTTLMANLCSTSASMTYVKLNAVGVDDKQQNANTVERQFAPVQGGMGDADSPWAAALVGEHRTDTKHTGLASHGRMSLPGDFITSGATGKITGARQFNGNNAISLATLSASYATFIEACAGFTGPGPAPASPRFLPAIVYTAEVGRVFKTPGLVRNPAASPINSVFISDIPGEMRSRQNKLRQGSARLPLTAGA